MNESNIYPRTGDRQTVYLKHAVKAPSIIVGDYTVYNDFVYNPVDFEKNNVLYHYPVNQGRLVIGKFCSIACGASDGHNPGARSAVPFRHSVHLLTPASCPGGSPWPDSPSA